MEWSLTKLFSLRAGLEQKHSDPAASYLNYSLGLGLDLQRIGIDYAYYYDGLLSHNSRSYVSLSVGL